MKAHRFMRIPFFVRGHQVTAENMETVANWCEGHVVREDGRPPFIRVPVSNPTTKRQTEAYEASWVIVSRHRGKRSFKVYSEDWLKQQFFEMPDEDEGDEDIHDEPIEPKPKGTAVVPPQPSAEHRESSTRRLIPQQYRGNSRTL